MSSVIFTGHSLPLEVEKVMVVENEDKFTENGISEFIKTAKKVKAFSYDDEGNGKQRYFWVIYPNNPDVAIPSTKKRLEKDLRLAEWDN
ncbi:MAG: hypothetical protein QM490_03125 [Candidatus Gracilibacteria bacterium]